MNLLDFDFEVKSQRERSQWDHKMANCHSYILK